VEEKIAHLRESLLAHAPLAVAYSGGVDSTCLLAFAHRVLGDRVTGVIADSPSLPRRTLERALRIAREIGVRVEVIGTTEFEDEHYLSNPSDRCYFCKAELFSRMDELAGRRGFAAIAYGENSDDPAHLRPGSIAAREFHVIAPLKGAGLTKADVRTLSREMALATADEPAQPCLSSRIPHGIRVTREAIRLVEQAEDALRDLGLRVFRVRYLGGEVPAAKLQVAPEEMGAAHARSAEIDRAILGVGFGSVDWDPAGYRSPAG